MVLGKRRQLVSLQLALWLEGKTVMLAAGDTFSAGAIDQLLFGENVLGLK